MKGKSLDAQRNARVKALLKKVVLEDFFNNQSAAAKALGVSQGFLSELVGSGSKGVGISVVENLARYKGITIDEIVTGQAPRPLAPGVAAEELAKLAAEMRSLAARIDALRAGKITPDTGELEATLAARVEKRKSKKGGEEE